MSRKNLAKTSETALFSFDELDAIQATGSAWKITPEDPATVPVPLQTVIMKIDGPYTQRDRKLWNFLVHAVFDELGEKSMHEVSIREINSVFRELGGDHNTDWIWESAKRLTRTVAEWECTLGDDRILGVAAIFGANLSKPHRQAGTLHFYIPPNLVPIIRNPIRFARLRLHFMIKLSGKYAVTLYEILEGFVNRRDGELDVSLKDLRTWLKVREGTYKNWKDFRKWVLDPAIKQINDDPLGAGFTVEYTPYRKQGSFYTHIKFKLTKTELRRQDETRLKSKLGYQKKIGRGEIAIPPDCMEKATEHARAKGFDVQVLLQEFKAWTAGKTPPKMGYGPAFVGFCKNKKWPALTD